MLLKQNVKTEECCLCWVYLMIISTDFNGIFITHNNLCLGCLLVDTEKEMNENFSRLIISF